MGKKLTALLIKIDWICYIWSWLVAFVWIL